MFPLLSILYVSLQYRENHIHTAKTKCHPDETNYFFSTGKRYTSLEYHHFMNVPVCPPAGLGGEHESIMAAVKNAEKQGVNAEQLKQALAPRVYLQCNGDREDKYIVRTLFAQASSSQDVSCSTLMISFISALIFSKVKLRFFKASSTPWLPDVLVVTNILIP